MKSCLNLVQLQTGLVEKYKKMSEPEPTSDRFGGKDRKAV